MNDSRRPGLSQLLSFSALLVLSACGTTTWTGARDAARGGNKVVESELALISGDPQTAANLAEAALAEAATPKPERLRAFLSLIVACDALGAIERPLLHLPDALMTAIELDATEQAEWIVAQAPRAWGRLDGQSAASPEVRLALLAVTKTGGDRWEKARSLAARELVPAERLVGGPSRALVASRAAGFLLDWRLSAPWGDAPLIDFDTPLPPESRPLGPTENTGSGYALKPVATTSGTFSDGEVTFFDLGSSGGVGFAESSLEVPNDGVIVLRLESNRLAKVLLANGSGLTREVLARKELEGPWLSETSLNLSAGSWRVTVKFASHDGRGFFRLQTSSRETLLAESARPTRPAHLRVGDGRVAVERLLALERQVARPLWDPRGAHAELAELERILGPHPTLELLAARLALGDTSSPESERREVARGRYRAVLARLPDHPVALRGLARLERDEERPDAALELLGRGSDPRTKLELLDLIRSRGWEVESLKLVESLAPLASASPRLSQELIDTWRVFGRFAEAQRMAEQLEMAFPGTGTDRLSELSTDRGQPPADSLVKAYQAEPQRHTTLRAAIAALRAKGDFTTAEALLQSFLESRPNDGWALGELVRIALQKGDLVSANTRARAVLEQHPDFAPFEGLVSQLADQPERLDTLADGPALLAAYRRFADTPEGKRDEGYPFVTVYDRVEVEVREDGSTLEVSHRIRLVQSKQGADALGDVRPPDGARLLVARTLKRDGRRLEPERTEGKADLSFPELEPGDAVETAWVSRSRVSPSEGGYLTGVAFASYNPVHRLEARFTHPGGLEIVPSFFGGAKAPVVSRNSNGSGQLRWEVDRMAATPREPLTVSARSFFPFVDLRVVATGQSTDVFGDWHRIARAYASRIMRLILPGARLAARVSEFSRTRDPVAAAFQFVKRDINDSEQLNAFETPVEAALASRKGNRALILYALLDTLGDAELLVCAPERDGRPEDRDAPTPNANRYFYPVVMWKDSQRTLYLDPSRPYTPLGDLPAELLGARCLVPLKHAEDSIFADLPGVEAAAQGPTFDLDIELDLAKNGDARGRLTGLAKGAAASPLRQAFIAQDAERRRLIFEQWLGTLFTGARLVELEVLDADESDVPMRFTLTFEAPGLAHEDKGHLGLRGFSKGLVAGDFAGVPELSQLVSAPTRQTPLRVLPYSEDVTVRVKLPRGFDLVAAPRDHETTTGVAHLSQKVDKSPGLVVTRRTVRLLPGRVEASAYPAFRTAVAQALFAFESPVGLAPKDHSSQAGEKAQDHRELR